MINVIAHNPVKCTVVLLIRVVVMVIRCAVTMTTVCWNLLLRCVMLHAITGTGAVIQRALAIRYETIWCRWWQLLLATGRRSTIGSDWWRRLFYGDFTSDVRLIWLDFTCTAMIQSNVCALMKISFFLLFRTVSKKLWVCGWHCANIWTLFAIFCAHVGR